MKNPVVIGKVLKPRGLKGEIKCSLSFDGSFESCRIGDIDFHVTKSSTYDGFTFLFLDTVTTVEQAERLRNKTVEIDRELMNLADDEILTSDLIGFEIVSESGKVLGKVLSVDSVGASDIIVSKDFSFPYEDTFVIETNMTERRIVVQANALEVEVCD